MSATAQIERLTEQMQRLKLVKTAEQLSSILQQAGKKDVTYSDFLEELLTLEIAAKQERHTTMKTSMARFPFHKSLESFDFKFQPSIDPKVIKELATCRFIADADNVLLLGPPGVGKTHLAVGVGLKACAAGYRTAFTTAAGLIATLMRAHAENRLDEKLKLLVQPKLLIIDEIGYLPIDRQSANLFFQLVSRRYEKGSILLTSNQSLTVWGEVFGDRVIATAILDRLLHHSTIVNIKGESYRLKEKRKAGLLTRSEPYTETAVGDHPAADLTLGREEKEQDLTAKN
jgi:DNA replication protein DnaC